MVADRYDAMTGIPTDGASVPPRLGQPHPALRGLLQAATAALPVMTRQGSGDIVAVAPIAGHVVRADGIASARVALEVAALCDALRRWAGVRGVRVAVVEPDLALLGPDVSSPTSPTAEDVAEAILYVLTRPPRVSVAEVLLRSTNRSA